jgi:hypothetical protein
MWIEVVSAGSIRSASLRVHFAPGGSSRNRAIPHAHRCEAPNESRAISAIAIAKNIAHGPADVDRELEQFACCGRLADIDAKLEQLAENPGAPHSGLTMFISRMSWRTSTGVFGRPPHERDFQRRCARKPARCERTQCRLALEDFQRVQHFGGEAIEARQTAVD